MSSTAPFGTPVAIGGEDTQEQQTVTNGVSSAPQEILDPNDPRLTSEPLDVNAEGDAYAQPAPPPDGRYRAKLKLVQVKDAQGQLHNYLAKMTKKPPVTPYYFTAIEADIIDPSGKYDGIKVFDYWVGTFMGRDNSTKATTILTRLRKPDGSPWAKPGERMSHIQWIQLLEKALAGEPEIGLETQWGWSCQACGEIADKKGETRPREVLGMNKFPIDSAKSKGGAIVYVPEMKCPIVPAHGYSRAQVRIARFLSLSELK